jgi:uncharacterized delta-60 repeat protein
VQSDGKIVVVGGVQTAKKNATAKIDGSDFGLVRFNTDGTLDSSFGSNGKVTTDFSTASLSDDTATGVALQLDGKIVVAGDTQFFDGSNHEDFALARYNGDGSLDTSLGTSGKVIVSLGSLGRGLLRSAAVQPDGRILIAGEGSVDPGTAASSFMIARLLGSTPPPVILSATVNGKKLDIIGENFDEGARILLNGEAQKTIFQSSAMLQGKKAGKFVRPGDKLQVRNSDSTISAEFTYAP